MKNFAFLFLTILNLFSITNADNADFGIVLFEDIYSHASEYYRYIMTGAISVPPAILTYMNLARTYTDDSFTSLLSDFPVNQDILSVVENLPWYSSRLESDLSVALTEDVTGSLVYSDSMTTQLIAVSTTSNSTNSVHNIVKSTYQVTSVDSFSLQLPTYVYSSSVTVTKRISSSSGNNTGATTSTVNNGSPRSISNATFLLNLISLVFVTILIMF